ncbi:MAG TPA: nucleotide disphospho-sugar-binding domain-containing protein, partial [Bryobacteraceae bacterium]|nr:nucleotide disphospho-sugar-binding domain-containing protein [Bryobacteraceae bacterium]
MARLGVFCPPWTGHLNPFSTLARELMRRGHEVIFFHLADFADEIRKRGLRFEAFGGRDYPAGMLAEMHREMSRLDGFAAMRAGLNILKIQAEALFSAAPPVIERAGLDLWLIDHLEFAASTLAACMRARYVTIIVGLMRHWEDGVPGWSGEPYMGDAAALERDRQFNAAMLASGAPYREYVGGWRRKAGLGPFSFDTVWSSLAQITQEPAQFEFPRRHLPACFHFTGPFARRDDRPHLPFPWQWLTGRPLIYASFGTAQNRNLRPYESVARAAANLDAQVVLSLGGAAALELPGDLPPNLLVVPFAPQMELLDRAVLAITHSGMNSTLECLAAGVPMVAVPISHDQAGVAARIEWTGTGLRVPASECEPERLRRSVETVLHNSSFRESAQRFQRIIAERNGPSRAADIIERVLATG